MKNLSLFGHIIQRLRNVWHLSRQNRQAGVGLGIVLVFLLVAFCGPLLIHVDPNALSADILQPPSLSHWLGTTQTGQDIFVQLIIGTRVSVTMGLVVGLLTTVVSVVVGLVSGYFGGVVDEMLTLLTNAVLVLPSIPLMLVLAAFLPYKGPLVISFVIMITNWAGGARTLRAQTLSMRGRESIQAAQAIGESNWRIIFYEILPNEFAVVAAQLIGTILTVIVAEASLEFLGLGDPAVISWGTMLYWAQTGDALILGAWWWFAAPGLCIAILGAALTFVNMGVDEIANPRLRQEANPKAGWSKLLRKGERK